MIAGRNGGGCMGGGFGGGYGGGFGGGYDSHDDFGKASAKAGAGASSDELGKLVDAFAGARVKAATGKKAKNSGTRVELTVNGSTYNATIQTDGTFTAVKSDGTITLSLAHDKAVWGSPLTLTYSNQNNPGQSGDTRDAVVCERARALAKDWAKVERKLDI